MSSVIVTWKGACPERETQDDLISFLKILAERSTERRATTPEETDGNRDEDDGDAEELLGEAADFPGSESPAISPIRLYDHEITGRIVVNAGLVQNQERLLAEAWSAGTPVITEDVEPLGFWSVSGTTTRKVLVLPALRLHGIDFELCGPFDTSSFGRMSFVFVGHPKIHTLSGCLAEVKDARGDPMFAKLEEGVVRTADWYLSTPAIDLRYRYERWTDSLLAWVKYFFIPGLHYWRHEDLSGYMEASSEFERLCGEQGRQEARTIGFQRILEGLERESA